MMYTSLLTSLIKDVTFSDADKTKYLEIHERFRKEVDEDNVISVSSFTEASERKNMYIKSKKEWFIV